MFTFHSHDIYRHHKGNFKNDKESLRIKVENGRVRTYSLIDSFNNLRKLNRCSIYLMRIRDELHGTNIDLHISKSELFMELLVLIS